MPTYVALASRIARILPSSERDAIDICNSICAQFRASRVHNKRHASLIKDLLKKDNIVLLVKV